MHRTTHTLSLLLATGFVGCVTPEPMTLPQPKVAALTVTAAPTSTPSQATVLPSNSEVAFYDLMQASGLETSLDLVTGRRVCTDSINTVVVMPSTKQLTINNRVFPMGGMIRWRNGTLYLPGEARSILAEHLMIAPVPQVAHDADRDPFDGRELHLRAWQFRTAPTGGAKRSQSTRPLPTAWRVKGERKWRYIVIHHSATQAGGAASFHREHAKKWQNGLGYHFVIGNGTNTGEGQVEVGPRWMRQGKGIDGAHAGNKRYNKHGIGICLVGNYSQDGPSPKQLSALRQLCRTLMERYDIPRSKIFPHRDVRRGHTDCPGDEFPFRAFLRSL